MIADRDEVVEWVINWRHWFLAGAKPPPPPVPRHLRDVLPEWAADDLDRSTDHPVHQPRRTREPALRGQGHRRR